MYGFYALSPTALAVIAFIGGFTALFAATMGLVKDELKQVLAYSTISQYGYMMLALGAGGYVAAVFHLTTHAFFKALLFLGAGAVIIAMHHNEDMWDMGGLKSKMPVTYYTFLAGSLALAGIFPFAGFWSKDEILYEALHPTGSTARCCLAAYAMGLLAVPVTAFYTFRMVFLTFHGEPRTETARDPQPVSLEREVPADVLGVLAAVIGFINMVPPQKVLDRDSLGVPPPLARQRHGGIEGLHQRRTTRLHDVATFRRRTRSAARSVRRSSARLFRSVWRWPASRSRGGSTTFRRRPEHTGEARRDQRPCCTTTTTRTNCRYGSVSTGGYPLAARPTPSIRASSTASSTASRRSALRRRAGSVACSPASSETTPCSSRPRWSRCSSPSA